MCNKDTPLKITITGGRYSGKTLLAAKLHTILEILGYNNITYISYSNEARRVFYRDVLKSIDMSNVCNDIPDRHIIIEDKQL